MSVSTQIRNYLRVKHGALFPGFTDEALLDYVLFHMERGHLTYAVGDRLVAGVLIGWRQSEPVPMPFTWQEADPAGGYWYWDLLAANDSTAALGMVASYIRRCPDAARLPVVALRNGRNRIYPPGAVLRIYARSHEHTQG